MACFYSFSICLVCGKKNSIQSSLLKVWRNNRFHVILTRARPNTFSGVRGLKSNCKHIFPASFQSRLTLQRQKDEDIRDDESSVIFEAFS